MKRPARKEFDQIGITLVVAGVMVALGVSTLLTRGLLQNWVLYTGLAVGLVLVVAGLWMRSMFREADPDQPRKPDSKK